MMETHKTVIQPVGLLGLKLTWGAGQGKDMSMRPKESFNVEGDCSGMRPPRGLAQGSLIQKGRRIRELLGEGNRRGDLLL